MKIKKVVIPTAGLATRMFPATKGVPKAMLPIFDKPTLQYVIEEVVEAGIDEVILIVNEDYFTIDKHFNSEINPRVKNSGNVLEKDIKALEKILKCKISFIIQKEQKGLGHAILCAKEAVNGEDFCVVLGDVIIDCKDSSCSVVGVEYVPDEKRRNYGILEGKEIEKNVFDSTRLIEKPNIDETNSNLAMVGRYIVKNEIFDILENQKAGKNGEIQFTDSLNELTLKGDLLGYKFDGKTYDVGNKVGVLIASIEYGLKDEANRDSIKEYLKDLVSSDFKMGE